MDPLTESALSREDTLRDNAKFDPNEQHDAVVGKEGGAISQDLPDNEDTEDLLDGGLKAWMALVASFLLNFVDLGFTYGFGVYQEQYKLREFPRVSTTLIDLIGSLCVALALFIGAFMGRPCQKFGFRAVSCVGAAVLFVGTFSAGFCDTVPLLVLCQGIIQGVGSGILFVPGSTLPAQWFARRRALAIGIGASGAGLGGVFWSLIGRLLISSIGRKWALRASALINLLLCGVAIIFLNERKTRRAQRDEHKTEPVVAWRMFHDPIFAVLYLCSGVSVFGYLVPFFYIPTWTSTHTSSTPFYSSLMVSMMNLASAMGRIVLGAIADTRVGRMNTVLLGMGCAGLSQWLWWSLANWRGSYGLAMACSVMYGFLGGGYIGIFPVVLAHVFDHRRLPAMTGLFFTSELLGQTTGGPIAGAILQSTGNNYYPMIIYSGSTLVVGSLLGCIARVMALRRQRRENQRELSASITMAA